jgi:hypothetical protein
MVFIPLFDHEICVIIYNVTETSKNVIIKNSPPYNIWCITRIHIQFFMALNFMVIYRQLQCIYFIPNFLELPARIEPAISRLWATSGTTVPGGRDPYSIYCRFWRSSWFASKCIGRYSLKYPEKSGPYFKIVISDMHVQRIINYYYHNILQIQSRNSQKKRVCNK